MLCGGRKQDTQKDSNLVGIAPNATFCFDRINTMISILKRFPLLTKLGCILVSVYSQLLQLLDVSNSKDG